VCVQVGAAGVTDEQRVAREHEPRLLGAAVVGHEVGVVREGVTGCGDGPDLRVSELDALAVLQRVVVELDPGAGREIGLGACARDELGQPGNVVGLHVRVEHGDDRRALRLGEGEVPVDQVDVRVDDGELPVRCAPEQVRGAGGLVV